MAVGIRIKLPGLITVLPPRFPALRPALPDPTSEAGGSEGMLADQVDYVVGVDTHRDEHVLAVVVAPAGAIVARRSVPANARGVKSSEVV